ncbi:MAG: alpha/beta fold hydrolase, partial [Planctomycetes bacterium]|nr:alpha/beta fold hydrolase [Planctomycetota bacterium]
MIGDRFFYYPNRRVYGSPEELGLAYEAVRFPTSDGLSLAGWFFPAIDAAGAAARLGVNKLTRSCPPEDQGNRSTWSSCPQDRGNLSSTGSDPELVEGLPSVRAHGTVLHLHGNAGNMTGHFQHVAWLPAAGWNVLCFDYRGYGESPGRTTRSGTVADAHAALDYLVARPDVDRRRIVAFGQSLGGAIGIVLVAQRPEIRGLATDGAFESYRRIAAWHVRHSPLLLPIAWWVPRLLIGNAYDPIDHVGRIAPRPLL